MMLRVCAHCQQPFRSSRGGRECPACVMYRYHYGIDRPPRLWQTPPPLLCLDCGRRLVPGAPDSRAPTYGRCRRCYVQHWRRYRRQWAEDPRPCAICCTLVPRAETVRGRCQRCYRHRLRTGQEWPHGAEDTDGPARGAPGHPAREEAG